MSQFNANNLVNLTDRPITAGAVISASDHQAWRTDIEARVSALNSAVLAVAYQQIGTSAPSGSAAGQIWNDSGNDVWNGVCTGTGTFQFGTKAAKIVRASSVDQNSYINSSGTAGTNNTAQLVKGILLKAGSLNAVGQSIRISTIYKATGGGSITGTLRIGTAGTSGDQSINGDGGSTSTAQRQTFHTLSYIDATHVNITGYAFAGGAVITGALVNATTNINFASDMTIGIYQDAVASTALTTFTILVEQLG